MLLLAWLLGCTDHCCVDVFPAGAPVVAITSPADGSDVVQPFRVTALVTDAGATDLTSVTAILSLDATVVAPDATVQANGTFSATVSAREGEHTVTLTSTDPL